MDSDVNNPSAIVRLSDSVESEFEKNTPGGSDAAFPPLKVDVSLCYNTANRTAIRRKQWRYSVYNNEQLVYRLDAENQYFTEQNEHDCTPTKRQFLF